ncbi:MAG: hypothetical protein ACLVC5_05905 [Clostridia bacterium]
MYSKEKRWRLAGVDGVLAGVDGVLAGVSVCVDSGKIFYDMHPLMLQKQKLFLQKKRDPHFFMNRADPFLSKSPLKETEYHRRVY